jgi:hypothetical protein
MRIQYILTGNNPSFGVNSGKKANLAEIHRYGFMPEFASRKLSKGKKS